MGLTKADIRDRARALLNETVEGFWLNSELEKWVDDSANDISTKTHCYEISTPITLATGVQLYTVSADYLKVIGAIYSSVGLKKATPSMEGLQTAVATGPPQFFFDIIRKVGFFPVPTSAENAKTVTVYHSSATDNIINIPTKFRMSSVLFVVVLGLIKERRYAQANQLYSIYIQSLNLDKAEIRAENTEQPPAQSQYILKLVGPQR